MADDAPPPGRPLPPPPPPAQAPIPPPAYVPAAPRGGPVDRVAGLALALRVLFWVAVVANAAAVAAAVNRKSVWDDFRARSATLRDVDDADRLIGAVVLAGLLVQLAVIIVLCVWSIRAARNANRLWDARTTPGLAGGGWFIPFANFIVPFVQLRRAAAAGRLSTVPVNAWQGTLVVLAVVNTIGRLVGDLDAATSIRDVSGRLTAQVWWLGLSTVAAAVGAVVASRAVLALSKTQEAAAPLR